MQNSDNESQLSFVISFCVIVNEYDDNEPNNCPVRCDFDFIEIIKCNNVINSKQSHEKYP